MRESQRPQRAHPDARWMISERRVILRLKPTDLTGVVRAIRPKRNDGWQGRIEHFSARERNPAMQPHIISVWYARPKPRCKLIGAVLEELGTIAFGPAYRQIAGDIEAVVKRVVNEIVDIEAFEDEFIQTFARIFLMQRLKQSIA